MQTYFVYMMTNVIGTVLYIGMTNNLERRVAEHKNLVHQGFSSKYRTSELVYYEMFSDPRAAIEREKQLK